MHGFDLFAFSDTLLTSSIFNESILLPGYSSPLRKDRIGKCGGGVALYVRDNIVVKRCVDLEPSNQLGNFKHNLLAYFGVSSCNPLYYVGNRFDSINHSCFGCSNSIEMVLFLQLALTATHPWKMLSTIFCTV